MLKKFLIGTVVALALLVGTQALAADFGTTTLRVGSKGPAVVALQTLVGATADGSFGPLTEAKVKVWQASNNLTPDGLFGNKSKAVAMGAYNSGNSNAAGSLCPNGMTIASLCTLAPNATAAPLCPNGMTVASNCATAGAATGALTGGAGTVAFSGNTTGNITLMKEGETAKVTGFKLEAQDSDIQVVNMKVELSNIATSAGSENVGKYVDSVDVYLGTTKVGSANLSDFDRTSATPDVYSKTIALSNAIVRDGLKGDFSVKITAAGSIDTGDLPVTETNIETNIASIRYQDASGVTMVDNSTDGVYNKAVRFEDSATNDALTKTTSTSEPAAAAISVKALENTDSTLIGAFKFKVSDSSSDVTVNSFPVVVTVASGGANADGADNVIDNLIVKVDGVEQDVSLTSELATATDTNVAWNGEGYATYTVDLGNGITVASGDTAEVKIYATFRENTSNYADNTTVIASVDGADVDAEATDTVVSTWTYTGKTMTLVLNGASAVRASAPTITLVSAGDSTNSIPNKYTAAFKFSVTAPSDTDVFVSNQAADYTYTLKDASGNSMIGAYAISTIIKNTDAEEGSYSWLVGQGDTVSNFEFDVNFTGYSGTATAVLTGIAYGTADTTGDNDSSSIIPNSTSFKVGPQAVFDY